MFIRQMEREIENYFAANVTVELEGSPGLGKSDAIEALVEKWSQRDGFEWGFGIAFLATYTPIDLMGYMVPVKRMLPDHNGDMHEVLVSEYTTPPWMLCRKGKPLNSYKKAVLLLDERDKGEPDVKKTAAELMLKKRIGPHWLGPNVHVIAASNRAKDRSGSTKDFDFIINRRGVLSVEPDFESWENWATAKGIKPVFTLFAKKYPQLIFSGEIPKEQGPYCTPRSYVAAIRLLEARNERMKAAGKDPGLSYGLDANAEEGAIVQSMVAGVIGEAVTLQLVTHLKMRYETPDYEQIVADPVGTPVPSRPDAKMLVAYECAYHLKAQDAKAVCQYIKHMPPEYHITFAKAAVKRDHRLILDPAMIAFVKGNTALMNAIG